MPAVRAFKQACTQALSQADQQADGCVSLTLPQTTACIYELAKNADEMSFLSLHLLAAMVCTHFSDVSPSPPLAARVRLLL